MRTRDADVRPAPSYCTVRWSSKGERHADAGRDRHHEPETSARQVRHRRRRRDDLYARLRHDDPRARHLGGAQRHRGCRTEGFRRRRHAVLPVGRFDLLDLHRRRSRHPAQLLHGRVRRRLIDRGAGRHGDGPDRGRHVQDRGDLPRHERLQPGAHRRHRRARRGAGGGRHAAHARLRLAERGPDVQPDLHAPHARLRHAARAGRRRQGDPQRARLEQPQGLLQEARHRRRGAREPHHLQAAASARLLRGDRQRHRARS